MPSAPAAPQTLVLTGDLTIVQGPRIWRELQRALPAEGGELVVDLAGVTRLDGAGAALLDTAAAQARVRGGRCRFTGARPEVDHLLQLYACDAEHGCLKSAPASESAVVQVGRASWSYLRAVRGVAEFLGRFVEAVVGSVRRPSTVQWRDVPALMERAGADGLAIVVLINFLIGFIMALQSAEQLARFGANVFVADLVGLSMTRELGPLMTAIIVTGRSGAAYAAEIGTMVVSEEVDALRTMRFDPIRFLVLPRLLALVTMVPLLVLVADLVGCLGGWLVAVGSLDLTSVAYVNELAKAIDLWDVFGGVLKSMVFAAVITMIACQRGLAVRGGAAGVGSATTNAVVTTLFSLVVLDALFTYAFRLLGI